MGTAQVFIEASVQEYHEYFVDASVTFCKVITCERDVDNVLDKYAIGLKNEGQVRVGHVPIELSKICSKICTVPASDLKDKANINF